MKDSVFKAYQRLELPALNERTSSYGHPHFDDEELVRLSQTIALLDGIAAEQALQQIKEFQSVSIALGY